MSSFDVPLEQMQTRRPRPDVARLTFGAATQGGLFRAVSEHEAKIVFQAAWDAGIRAFDTAPWYGYGQSERWLGAFLRGKTGFTVSTKIGKLLHLDIVPHATQLEPDGSRAFKTDSPLNVSYDYSYDGALRSLEGSLGRLGLTRVDTLYIHDPDAVGAEVSDVLSGAGRALLELCEQGVVQHIGAGMNQWQMPLEFARHGGFDQFLLAGRYTLLEQSSLEFMDYCAMHSIGVAIGGVYNSGLLAKPSAGASDNYAPVSAARLERALHLQTICEHHGVTLRSAALQFPLAHPAVGSVIVAARTSEQLRDNVAMFTAPIPAELWSELRGAGLLDMGVPTPNEAA